MACLGVWSMECVMSGLTMLARIMAVIKTHLHEQRAVRMYVCTYISS